MTTDLDKITVGTVVQLKSGGPYMTVVRVPECPAGEGSVDCAWFVNSFSVSLSRDHFSCEALLVIR